MEAWWCSKLLSVHCIASSSHVHMGFFWVRRFPITSNHASRWIGGSKLPLSLNKCVNMCVHGSLEWTGIP